MASPSHYKHKAEYYANKVTEIGNYQNEVKFRRQLLSNIRQARIARAQLEVGNYNPAADISTQQGAIANIESSLAGEADFSYSSSVRQQQMTDYTNLAQKYYKKYQKAQKRRAGVFSTVGMVAGAALGVVTGGLGFGLTGAALAGAGVSGAQIGQGLGQIASGTGQTQQGIQNILSGAAQSYNVGVNQELIDANNANTIKTPQGYNRYETYGVNPSTGRYIPNTYASWMLPQNQMNVVSILGGNYAPN